MMEKEKQFEEVYVATSFGRMRALISCSRQSDAETYFLLHGLLCSGTFMEPTAQELAPQNTVCIPDMIGYGRSETPERALNIEEHAAALKELIEALGLVKPVLVGGSYGCNIAAELGAQLANAPAHNVKGLVLIGPADVQGKSVRELLGNLAKDGLHEPAVMVPNVIGDVSRIGVDRCLQQLDYMADHEFDKALLDCSVPILLIKGELDQLSSEELVQEKFHTLPNCQAINVIGSAHCLSVSDPALIAEMVQDFVEQGDLSDAYRAA